MTASTIREVPAAGLDDIGGVLLELGVDELEALDAPFDWRAFWVGAEAGALTVAVIGTAIALT